MSEVILARTADQPQRDAFNAFTELVDTDPRLTMRVFDLYEQQNQLPADHRRLVLPEEERALGTIASFFDTGSDGYVNFGSENDKASESTRNAWMELNLASKGQTESAAVAKLVWRRERVRLYIANALDAQQRTTADQDAHSSSQLVA